MPERLGKLGKHGCEKQKEKGTDMKSRDGPKRNNGNNFSGRGPFDLGDQPADLRTLFRRKRFGLKEITNHSMPLRH
jgi:hypothetical protein